MRLDKSMIGKFVTRTGPCKYKNGTEDRSYIGEKIKLLSLDNNFIRCATRHFKTRLDSNWDDENWELYIDYDMIDINNLSTNELYLLRDSLKAMLVQAVQNDTKFYKLNEITKLGKSIEKQLDALPF